MDLKAGAASGDIHILLAVNINSKVPYNLITPKKVENTKTICTYVVN